MMTTQFSPDTLDMMRDLKLLFDPDQRLNPGKMAPTGRGCLEIHQPPLAAGRPVLLMYGGPPGPRGTPRSRSPLTAHSHPEPRT